MGTSLFGVNIAALVAKHVGPGLPEAVLTRFSVGPRSPKLTAGRSRTPITYPCRAIWEDFDPSDVDGVNILAQDRRAMVLGDTLPVSVTPQNGDQLMIKDHEGTTLSVVRVLGRDPAGAAYTLQCRDERGVNGV